MTEPSNSTGPPRRDRISSGSRFTQRPSTTPAGEVASVYLEGSDTPTLVVPRLAGVAGTGVGIWMGNFGKGAYFSNFTVTPSPNAVAAAPAPPLPGGMITDWSLSQVLDAPAVTPGKLPPASQLAWQKVAAEPTGLVLINRYRVTPIASVPRDSATGEVIVDSLMGGRVRGSKVVFARTEITADRDGMRRMQFSYSDAIVVYANGQPLYFGMNAQGFRDDLGVMSPGGDAVYLPLKRGRNEIVVAVTEFSGGWAFWAKLDSPR